MAIDPDLYEKVTGRAPGDAQRKLGESLAQRERWRAKAREERETMPRWVGFWNPEFVLLRWALERGEWKALLVFTAIVAAITLFLIFK